jgi:hypothetical protein
MKTSRWAGRKERTNKIFWEAEFCVKLCPCENTDGQLTRKNSTNVRVTEQRRSHAPDSNSHLPTVRDTSALRPTHYRPTPALAWTLKSETQVGHAFVYCTKTPSFSWYNSSKGNRKIWAYSASHIKRGTNSFEDVTSQVFWSPEHRSVFLGALLRPTCTLRMQGWFLAGVVCHEHKQDGHKVAA